MEGSKLHLPFNFSLDCLSIKSNIFCKPNNYPLFLPKNPIYQMLTRLAFSNTKRYLISVW
jgi:hypothetical protein